METDTVFYSITKFHMSTMLTLTGKGKVIPELFHVNVSPYLTSFQYYAALPTESEAYLEPIRISATDLFCESS